MKNFFTFRLKVFYYIILSFLLPIMVIAGTNNPPSGSGGKLQPPLGSVQTFEAFIGKILNIVTQIGFPIVVLALVYSGFLFVKAQGKPEEITKAKTAFMWTIVGAAVLLGAEVLGSLVSGTITNLK